ncbi:MAG: TraB/GumN family protein, partial [Flavobacteriales bacterium]
LRDDWVQTKKNQYEAPDSVKIKLLFYLQDALFQNDGKNLFFEQIWMQQAMATKKEILGFETYQKHYKDLAQITLPEQIEFMNSIKNVEKFKTEFNDAVVDYYFSGEYEKIYTEHLNKFNYNKTNYGNLWVKKHRDWATTIDPILDSQSCFISLEVQHLFGKENFIDNLLSKGYKVKKIQ